MNIGTMINNYKSTAIGASQKTEEKPKKTYATYAKMIDDTALLRCKTDTGVKYTVKLPYEKEPRQVLLLKNKEDGAGVFISLPGDSIDSHQDEQIYFMIQLKKESGNYKSSSKPYCNTGWGFVWQEVTEESKKILTAVLNPVLKGEEYAEYKKILSAAIEALK